MSDIFKYLTAAILASLAGILCYEGKDYWGWFLLACLVTLPQDCEIEEGVNIDE